MYTIKTKKNENITIQDIGIVISGSNSDGVKVDEYLFDLSKDAKTVIDHLDITSDGIDMYPNKTIVETLEDVQNLKPIDNMCVYVKNLNETNNPSLLIYLDKEWKVIGGGGSGSGGGAAYIHPKNHPASMITEDENHKFVSQQNINKWNGTAAKLDQLEYKSLKGVPELYSKEEIDKKISSIKTFSGNYKDLIGIPTVYSKEETDQKISGIKTFSGNYQDLKGSPEVYTKQEINQKLGAIKSFSGNYKDLIGSPTVYTKEETDQKLKAIKTFSGNYNDLQNKPETYSKSEIDGKLKTIKTFSGKYSDLSGTPIVYTKEETNNKLKEVKLYRYELKDSGGSCIVLANNEGITSSKSKNTFKLTIPKDTQLLSCQVIFSKDDIIGGECTIDYGESTQFNSSYNNLFVPQFQIIKNNSKTKTYLNNQTATVSIDGHTIKLSGLEGDSDIIVRLNF